MKNLAESNASLSEKVKELQLKEALDKFTNATKHHIETGDEIPSKKLKWNV